MSKGGKMMRSVLKNRKGFTLVEVLVTVAILAVVAGTAIGTGVFKSAERQQRMSADADTQQMFRVLYGCAVDLAANGVYPDKPWNHVVDGHPSDYTPQAWDIGTKQQTEGGVQKQYYGYYDAVGVWHQLEEFVGTADATVSVTPPSNGGYYSFYAWRLVYALYMKMISTDIPVRCCIAAKDTDNNLAPAYASSPDDPDKVPPYVSLNNKNPARPVHITSRESMLPAGNRDSYMVVQVRRFGDRKVVILTYHNAKRGFEFGNVTEIFGDDSGESGAWSFYKNFNPYESNRLPKDPETNPEGLKRRYIAYAFDVPARPETSD